MPKETFLNLAEDKRELITRISLEEFATYDYRTASLSRIVEKAEIAKGSMYQYFENKKDLYLYLVDLAANVKLEYLGQYADVEETDFFKMLKQLNYASARFDFQYPLYSGVLYNATREKSNDEIGDISSKVLGRSDQFLQSLIARAQEDGQLRQDIDSSLLGFLISRITIQLDDYISSKFNISYRSDLVKGKKDLGVSERDIEEILDELIQFLKTGLHK